MATVGGRPLQIMCIDEEGSINLNKEDLLEVLGRDDVKNTAVAVLSVAGAFRTGKSFLLNYLLRYLNNEGKDNWAHSEEALSGFDWSQGAHRITTGILFWSQPFKLRAEDGRVVNIILMDTEGLFDSKVSLESQSDLFCMSVIISSIQCMSQLYLQIYNVTGKFEDTQFQQLELFLERAQMVLALAKKTGHGKSFQRLVYLIRDWIDAARYKYGEDGGEKYLSSLLEDEKQPGEFWKLHENVKTCFEQISCFLMPHPGLNVAETKALDGSSDNDIEDDSEFKGHFKKLRGCFRKSLENLAPYLLHPTYVTQRKIGKLEINGQMLQDVIEKCVSVLKSGQLPKVSSPRQVLIRDFNSWLTKDLVQDHESQVEKIRADMEATCDLVDPREWENVIKGAEEQRMVCLEANGRGDRHEQNEFRMKLEACFFYSRSTLTDLANSLNFDKILIAHQARLNRLTEEKWSGFNKEDIEKKLLAEEQKTRDILDAVASGNLKEKEHFCESVETRIRAFRSDFDRGYNNSITNGFLENHKTRVKVIADNIADKSLSGNALRCDISSEEEYILDVFTKEARGGEEEMRECYLNIEDCLQTSREALQRAFNERILQEVLANHQLRAQEVYDFRKPERLDYPNNTVQHLIKTEEATTLQDFQLKALLDTEDDDLYIPQIKDALKPWQEKIQTDQEEKKNVIAILERLIPAEDNFKDYLTKSEKLFHFTERKAEELSTIAKQIEKIRILEELGTWVTDTAAAIGTGYTLAKPDSKTSAVMLSVAGSMASMGIGMVSYSKWKDLQKSAATIIGDYNKSLRDIEETLERVVRIVKEGSPGLNIHKVINIVLSAVSVNVPLRDYINRVIWYILEQDVIPKVYFCENALEQAALGSDHKELVVVPSELFANRYMEQWQGVLEDENTLRKAALFLHFKSEMEYVCEKIKTMNAKMTAVPYETNDM